MRALCNVSNKQRNDIVSLIRFYGKQNLLFSACPTLRLHPLPIDIKFSGNVGNVNPDTHIELRHSRLNLRRISYMH